MGQQVGNGECWTLANDALVSVAQSCRSAGLEPCMTSQGVSHGFALLTYIPPSPPSPSGGVLDAGISRGDIIQFWRAHFKHRNGESWAGDPDHTSVVTGVRPDGTITVVEQNVGGVKKVRTGEYDLGSMIKGEARVFRAAGESWLGKLEAKWP